MRINTHLIYVQRVLAYVNSGRYTKKKNVANLWNVDQPLSVVLGFWIDKTEAAVSREPKYHSWLGGNIYTPVTPDEPANLGTNRQPL